MKIILEDEKIGKFEWTVPSSVEQVLNEISRTLREKMKLSDADASLAERQAIEEVETLILIFLHTIVGAQLSGPYALVMTPMIRERMAEINHDFLALLRTVDKKGD